ncbi:MAG TPA: c-type cytochrome [Gemmatimonadaceae bacterium]|jgi:mono/diheme cytochrome c family protein|nr:c-type cytochrome [Gemmatimonadaceae bacterium]
MAHRRTGESRVTRAGVSIAVIVWLAAVSFAAQGDPAHAAVKNPVMSTPESIAAGKALFTKTCAPCHGVNATGGSGNDISPPSPDLTDAEWQHGGTDGEIFFNVKEGIPPDLNMGPFKARLKDDDIWSVVNYLRSIAKK